MFRPLKLQPPHGWPAVAWELAIVTIGVLIALGAQQIAEEVNNRSVARQTRAEVTDELNSDLMSIQLRQSIEPCIERRLDELRRVLAEWQLTGSFTPPKWVSQSPPIEVELSRYEAALSAGRLALLSGEEQYRMGAVAGRIRRFDDWQFRERLPWGQLRALQFGPKLLSAEDRARLRASLQEASTLNYESKVNAAQALSMARRYDFHPDPQGFREFAPGVWPGGKFTPSVCLPITTHPEEANKSVVTPLPL